MRAGIGMFALAALLVAAHGLAELRGLRDWVSVLSGTPVIGVPYAEAALGGALYVLSYFGAVLAAPILVLAGTLSGLAARLTGPRRATARGPRRSGPDPRGA